jgi:hypothetical protein
MIEAVLIFFAMCFIIAAGMIYVINKLDNTEP